MKNFKTVLAGLTGAAIIATYAISIPAALASVSFTVAPTAAITSPLVLPPNSQPTVLFSFSLNATAGETLSSVSVEIDKANSVTQVASNHLLNLSIYKDNGDGVFNVATDSLLGSQSNNININSPSIIMPYYSVTASGEFFVTLNTSANWNAASPADSIIATFPTNGIMTSANSPTTTQVSTAAISASSNLAQTTISQQLSVPANTNVDINQAVYDTAGIGNTNGQAGGTVTYNVYLGAQCTGAVTFTDSEPVILSEPAPSKSFSTTATGTYSWQALYSGDSNNTNATSSCATKLVDPTTPSAPLPPVTPPSSGSLPVTGMSPIALLLTLGSGAALIVKKLSFK